MMKKRSLVNVITLLLVLSLMSSIFSGCSSSKVIDSIIITVQPTKTEYIEGETFDATGMVVMAIFSDESIKVVDNYIVDTTTVLKTDDTAMAITYDGKTTTVAITVKHVHTLTKTEAVDATCTSSGNIAYWTCSECDKIYSDASGTDEITLAETMIEATGHSYTSVYTAGDCDTYGYTTYTCAECGDTYTVYDTEYGLHDYEAVVTAPTCTEQGYTTYTCTKCGDSYVDDYVDALGHTLVKTEAVTATTTQEGNIDYWTCIKCGKIYSDEAGTKEITLEQTVIVKVGQVTYTFEAEGLDFTGLSTPAFSGTYSGTDMIFRASNYEGSPAFASSISNGYFIGATHEAGLTLTYTIVSDMDAKDASITLRLASQMRSNQSIDNDVFDVKINGTSLDYTAFTLNASTSDNYETPFVDFTLDATFDLVKGDNTISLVVMENDIAADWGGTYDSTAGPGIDNIKVTTYAGLTWPTDKWASNEAILNFGS